MKHSKIDLYFYKHILTSEFHFKYFISLIVKRKTVNKNAERYKLFDVRMNRMVILLSKYNSSYDIIKDERLRILMYVYNIMPHDRYNHLKYEFDYNGFQIIQNNEEYSTYLELYDILIKNNKTVGQIKRNFKRLLYYFRIDETFPELMCCNNLQELYNKIFPNTGICKSCGNQTKYKSFIKGYKLTCSLKCQTNLSSIRMKLDNPVNKMTDEQKNKIAEENSKRMKKMIAEGTFTPTPSNSFTWKDIDIDNIKFRSSWEAYFYIVTGLEYETVRIPYTHKGKIRNYIVDFVDHERQKLYEIKPSSKMNDELVKIKENASIIWCKERGYSYEIITEKWFEINYNPTIIDQYEGIITDECKTMLKRRLRNISKNNGTEKIN